MIEEVCAYLNNWFDRDYDGRLMPRRKGEIAIADGGIDLSGTAKDGQYFRIIGSSLNDGVYKYPASGLKDETFNGVVQSMRVPYSLEKVVGEMEAWMAKHGEVLNSPYQSESFGGYSYSKAGSESGNSVPAWAAAFGGRLARWRKIR